MMPFTFPLFTFLLILVHLFALLYSFPYIR
jgi:hypothetical protein